MTRECKTCIHWRRTDVTSIPKYYDEWSGRVISEATTIPNVGNGKCCFKIIHEDGIREDHVCGNHVAWGNYTGARNA